MTSIRSFAEILLDDGITPEERRRFVATIHGESLRLTRLLDEILDLSALERGERAWENQTIDAEAALDRAIDVCDGLARQRRIRLALGHRAGEARVLGEADRLCQVLINLISNAIKFNDADNPVVTVRSYLEAGAHVIEIEANGPGIAPADRKRVFEKFWRGRNAASGGHAGTGLGLAISRSIIARMNGSLELVPRRGRGACFRIVLPLAS
jgi:signal transduction histidine kinase